MFIVVLHFRHLYVPRCPKKSERYAASAGGLVPAGGLPAARVFRPLTVVGFPEGEVGEICSCQARKGGFWRCDRL